MTIPVLLKDTAGSVTAFIERRSDGSPILGLTSSDVLIDTKKATASSFSSKTLIDPESATADIGSGANGTVTTTVDAVGVGGNSWTIEVVVPGGTSGLSVSIVGQAITVSLAVNAGVPDGAQNTATLVAAAIDAESGVTAVPSGTGADPLTMAEGPTTFSGGLDGNFREFSAGFYEIDLDSTETDVLGSLDLRISGPVIKTQLVTASVQTQLSSSSVSVQPPPRTSLFGFVYGADGSPLANRAVSARVLATPSLLHPQDEGMVLGTSLVTVKTDLEGFFTISLISGSQVDVFIPSAGFRRTLTVPSSSANLFDIP